MSFDPDTEVQERWREWGDWISRLIVGAVTDLAPTGWSANTRAVAADIARESLRFKNGKCANGVVTRTAQQITDRLEGIGHRTVQRCLIELETDGWTKVSGKESRQPNEYRVPEAYWKDYAKLADLSDPTYDKMAYLICRSISTVKLEEKYTLNTEKDVYHKVRQNVVVDQNGDLNRVGTIDYAEVESVMPTFRHSPPPEADESHPLVLASRMIAEELEAAERFEAGKSLVASTHWQDQVFSFAKVFFDKGFPVDLDSLRSYAVWLLDHDETLHGPQMLADVAYRFLREDDPEDSLWSLMPSAPEPKTVEPEPVVTRLVRCDYEACDQMCDGGYCTRACAAADLGGPEARANWKRSRATEMVDTEREYNRARLVGSGKVLKRMTRLREQREAERTPNAA